MATSEVAICNSGLIQLGVESITSFNDNSKQARLCKEQYPKLRDKLLQSHYWNFAIKRAELATVSPPPLFGFSLKYQIPSDSLSVIHLNEQDFRFKVEDQFLLTNVSGVRILYVAKITDVSKFTPMFAELLALDIAINLAMSLTQKRTLRADLIVDRKELVRDVRSADGQEGFIDDLESDVFLDARVQGAGVIGNVVT